MATPRDLIAAAITRACDAAIAARELRAPDGVTLPPVSVERPARPEHGDYASNVAMQLAPLLRDAPMRIAATVERHLGTPEGVSEVSIAPPGFINLRLDPGWVAAQVATILAAGGDFGRVRVAEPKQINVEFVSANPTGPLTVGNARGAFVGDLLARVLESVGHQVTREYYFNDTNTQVVNLGRSVLAHRSGEPVPDDGYHGDYVAELAAQIPPDVWAEATAEGADDARILGRWAARRVRTGIEQSLAELGVRFDTWTTEGSLVEEGWVQRALDRLRGTDHLYESEGATWFRSSAFGDDKDRVVIRSNGQPTYFAFDLGYLEHKFSRGFDELIYLWGEDHSGTVPRNRAAAEALGHSPEAVHWMLIAWVRFVRDGTEVGMSKRAGEFVTLDELLAEIGPDAARWFFGSRAASSGIDFDIELAKSQSAENPVYYVQYAHARCASILRNAQTAGVEADTAEASVHLRHPAEQALIRLLVLLPEVVAEAAERRETHDVTRYCLEVAQLFSQFYRDCRVLPEDPAELPVSRARLALTDATRQVIANGLGLLGISAPDSM